MLGGQNSTQEPNDQNHLEMNYNHNDFVNTPREGSNQEMFSNQFASTQQSNRPRLTRAKEVVFKNYQQLRGIKMSQVVQQIATEITGIISLGFAYTMVKTQNYDTMYTQNEQAQLCAVVGIFIIIFTSLTVFRAVTIDVPCGSETFIKRLFILNIVLTTMIVQYIGLMYQGWQANRNIIMYVGFETTDNLPESLVIHHTNTFFSVMGAFLVSYLMIFITLCLVFGVSVQILERDGNLGDTSLLNQENQRLLRNMSKLPYGSILFIESKDCALCLDKYQYGSEISQLSCNKFHIYHYHCLKQYMETQAIAQADKKCIICQSQISIQDPPIFE